MRTLFKRTHDQLNPGFSRPSSELPALVGIFEGNRCRVCEATFSAETDQTEHRHWHEWLDENRRYDDTTAAESPFYERLNLHELDGTVIPLPPPTLGQLRRHEEKFMPPRSLRAARKFHREAIEETAALFGLAGDDLTGLIREARRAGKSVSEIAEDYGVPEETVAAGLG